MSWFSLNKTSGHLTLERPLWLSTLTSLDLDLVVKATDDCWSGYWEVTATQRRGIAADWLSSGLVTWSAQDASLLLVRVSVVMATRFTVTSLYAGVLPQVQRGHAITTLTVGD